MADETSFNRADIDKAADAIGGILDERRDAFQNLVSRWPNAGHFATAQWLERIVDDRRNGLVEHEARLNEIFETMQTKLKSIASNLEDSDGDNAAALESVHGMQDEIITDVSSYAADAENSQMNFTQDEDNALNDGDGYNDFLPTTNTD
jgi:hypothetical protein